MFDGTRCSDPGLDHKIECMIFSGLPSSSPPLHISLRSLGIGCQIPGNIFHPYVFGQIPEHILSSIIVGQMPAQIVHSFVIFLKTTFTMFGPTPEHVFHPYCLVRFQEILFTHIFDLNLCMDPKVRYQKNLIMINFHIRCSVASANQK